MTISLSGFNSRFFRNYAVNSSETLQTEGFTDRDVIQLYEKFYSEILNSFRVIDDFAY